jgi:hypothetical protein
MLLVDLVSFLVPRTGLMSSTTTTVRAVFDQIQTRVLTFIDNTNIGFKQGVSDTA